MKKYILSLLLFMCIPFAGVYAQYEFPDGSSVKDLGVKSQPFEIEEWLDVWGGEEWISFFYYTFTLEKSMEIEITVPENPFYFYLETINYFPIAWYNYDGSYEAATIKRLLPPGQYVVEFENPAGDILINIKGTLSSSEPLSGTTIYNPIEIGEISGSYTYEKTTDASLFKDNTLTLYDGSLIFSHFKLLKPMSVSLTHCGSGIPYISSSLTDFSATAVGELKHGTCHNSQHSFWETDELPAGDYYIGTYSPSTTGQFYTKITFLGGGAPLTMDTSIDLGVKYMDFECSDTQEATDYYNSTTPGAIYYKLNLYNAMSSLTAQHSGLSDSNTRIALLNSAGSQLVSSSTKVSYSNLSAGNYYIKVSGFQTLGSITTSIQGAIKDPSEVASPNRHLSADNNYIFTIIPTIASSIVNNLTFDKSLQTVEYFDALGRSEETIQLGITPAGESLFTYQEYDDYGRPSKKWLPVIATFGNGVYLEQLLAEYPPYSLYDRDADPYTLTIYEDSPLNRVIKEYGPGQEWYAANKAIQKEYLTNNQSTHSCLRLRVDDIGNSITISPQGTYASGALYVDKLISEDGNISYEFKDKRGLLLLTRQMDRTASYDTYYIYDAFDNLRVVLPPLAVDNLTGSGPWNNGMAFINEFAYLYKYDYRNRCVAKKLPGADWNYYVYDKNDRLIFSQDGPQRKNGQWMFSIPDGFGRELLTGLCTQANGERINEGCMDNKQIKATYTKTGSLYGYSLTVNGTPFILSNVTMHNVNYYDGYHFLQHSECTGKGLEYTTPESEYGFCNDYVKAEHTMLTGNILFNNNTGSVLSCTAFYYDYRGRLVQSHKAETGRSAKESQYTGYNFTGLPLQQKFVHTVANGTTQTEYYTYNYDHAGRLKETFHQINSAPKYLLAKYEYDELGRPKSKVNHSETHIASKQTYDYNVRSWTTKMQSLPYTHELYYNLPMNGSASYFNGNIGAMRWKFDQ